MDFPPPDFPTIATSSPGSTRGLMPLSAVTYPAGVLNQRMTARSSTADGADELAPLVEAWSAPVRVAEPEAVGTAPATTVISRRAYRTTHSHDRASMPRLPGGIHRRSALPNMSAKLVRAPLVSPHGPNRYPVRAPFRAPTAAPHRLAMWG